jgi:hypothetical protein
VALLPALAACNGGSRLAYGDVNRVIVVAPDELWDVIGDSVMSALEPRIFTIRDERTFELTHISPQDPNYGTLRQFRQVLVIGHAEHTWVEPVLAGEAVAAPAIVERRDIWARRQLVTALVLPAEGAVEATYAQLPALWEHFDSRYRTFVRQRMYASDPDSALQRRLAAEAGFSLLLPTLYRTERRDDALLFRTESEMGAQLMRTVTVVSRPGLEPVSGATALAWRDSLAATLFDPPHRTLLERFEERQLAAPGGGVEVQGSWSALHNGWPYGGPYVSRVIPCPAQDRTYLVDAWVFAPGRPKYEYMIQFETLFDTFACAP